MDHENQEHPCPQGTCPSCDLARIILHLKDDLGQDLPATLDLLVFCASHVYGIDVELRDMGTLDKAPPAPQETKH